MKFDFSGWATKNDIRCKDGRTIRRGAFSHQDGTKVPLVWMHNHKSVDNVLGHAYLENRPEGVYAYGVFNNTPSGQNAKEAVRNGDVSSLSIWANELTQRAGDVLHGAIKEVSLVLAGANPGALIDMPILQHSDGSMEEDETCAAIYNDEMIHAEPGEVDFHFAENNDDHLEHADTFDPETVMKSMNSDQEYLTKMLMGMAYQDGARDGHSRGFQAGSEKSKDDITDALQHAYDEGAEDMRRNVFENNFAVSADTNVISHDDMKVIMEDARRCGSLKEAVLAHMEDGGILAHSIDTTGMTVPTEETSGPNPGYGVYSPDFLFPDYKSLNTPPEWIKRDMGWVAQFMGKVHHTPFSRIKSIFADITEDEARAKGYLKAHQKSDEVFTLLKRTTDPQTVYKRQKFDRDDLVDITDFDVVAWIRGEMRMMLNEELARAMLIGDGRSPSSPDKIQELHIRPILTDVPLFTIRQNVTFAANADEEAKARALIKAAVRGRKTYKGTGSPTMYTTEDWLTEMLLIEDTNQHRLYKTENEVAQAMRVSSIQTNELMEGLTMTEDGVTYDVHGIIVNPNDYNVGADRGGAINSFDDFDINFNQQIYLIETRISGALIKPYSAIVLRTPRTSGNNEGGLGG